MRIIHNMSSWGRLLTVSPSTIMQLGGHKQQEPPIPQVEHSEEGDESKLDSESGDFQHRRMCMNKEVGSCLETDR